MGEQYQEAQAEEFYDRQDAVYRSFWDSSGSLHWGYFADLSETDPARFPEACQRWTDLQLMESGIGSGSHVLDVGCGNGNTSAYLALKTGCKVTGIDISGVRIDNARAQARARDLPDIEFHKASASHLPFADGTFTHVWSQATLYHVPDRDRALCELHRVLAEGGRLVLDDLVTPSSAVTDRGRRSVYERLMFQPGPGHRDYVESLRAKGFAVLSEQDLTPHLRKSYELLAERARLSFPEHSEAYLEVLSAIDARDVGWSSFVGTKVSDPLTWVYGRFGDLTLQQKYDAWSATYDKDVYAAYQNCPQTAASLLADLMDDRNARILDVGAGTGLCGVALAERGFGDITGVDLSDGMLEQAERKGVYHALVQHDIEQPLPWDRRSFDAVVATGVFTFAHARVDALGNILDMVRDGGYFVVTFRDDFLDSDPGVMRAIDGLPMELRSRTRTTIFDDEEMQVLAFQKCEK